MEYQIGILPEMNKIYKILRQNNKMINRKTIAIANQKGGVGKINITFNHSGALAERKKKNPPY